MNAPNPFRLRATPALLLLAAGMAGCQKAAETAAQDPGDPKVEAGRIVFPDKSPQLAAIAVAAVKPCSDCRVRLNGRLAWDEDLTVRVFSPFAGRLGEVRAALGSRVEKDAPLALVASPDFGQAQADARRAATDLSLAERNASRLRSLAEHGAAAAKDVAAAEADLARAQSESRRTSARLELYGAKPDAVDNTFTLKSPIAGVVVEKNLNVGQEVRPDQMLANVERIAAPLFVVTDPSRLWVLLEVTEADAALIEVGQTMEVRVPSHPGRVFHAVVAYDADSLDPVTRTIKVRASVDNADRQLKAEQLVSVEAVSPVAVQQREVPASAVFLRGDRHFVFAEASAGVFERREVRVGTSREGRVRVRVGLGDGDRVVTDGVMLLEQVWDTLATEPVAAAAPTGAGRTGPATAL